MKRLASRLAAVVVFAGIVGCSYGGVAGIGDDKVVITRNDAFLFGALRKVFVCKVNSAGLTRCADRESP